MNTKLIGIVAAVVVIGAGAYFIFGRTTSDGPGTSGPEMQTGSFRSLASASSPQECRVTSTKEGITSSGVTYVAPGLMRGDFTTVGTPSGDVESHLIVKDNMFYMWSSAAPQGFKMALLSSANGSAEGSSGSFGYDDQVSYSCESWSVDQSKFALPSGVVFTDVSQSFGGAAGAAANEPVKKGSAEQCGACASLSGSQKAQCLVALSCQ